MSSSDLISIIVPVFKVEDYLDRCITSIVNQTYDFLEIILVDDGSPDNCPNMCDEWARNDSRIKVIHKENGGLSDARNAGLAIAKGEIISFVDSDDWLHKDFYKILFQTMISNDCDVVSCNYQLATHGKTDEDVGEVNVNTYSRNEAMSMLIDDQIKQVVWNKLYKASVIKGILFEKGKYHEDVFWSYQVIGRIKKYAHVSFEGYYYFQREDSIMGNTYSLKRLDAVKAKVLRQQYLEENIPELASQGKIDLYFTCLYHGQCSLRYLHDTERKNAMRILKGITRKYQLNQKQKKTLSFTHRTWIEISNVSFSLACKIRNMLKIGT